MNRGMFRNDYKMEVDLINKSGNQQSRIDRRLFIRFNQFRGKNTIQNIVIE